MSGSLWRKDRREAARAREKTISRIQLAEEAGWWVAAVGRIVMPLTSSRYMILAHKRKWGAVRRWK